MIGRALRGPLQAVQNVARYFRPCLPRGQYTLLSARPALLLVADYAVHHPRASFLRLLDRLRHARPHVYYSTSWFVHEGLMADHLGRLRLLERACPGAGITVLCQTAAETALFASRGVDSLFCNQNALADERLFRPLPGTVKRFDAIYDATLAPYKRHALSSKVPSLALLGYLNPGTGDPAYCAEVVSALPSAHWFNDPASPPSRWRMTDEQVNGAYNECRVGLCLSEVEGAMWASIQYLLAGLPVVSTPSQGGREEFFEPPHVVIAEPAEDAIAEAVARLTGLDLGPWTIRERTLALMAGHRSRFIDHVQRHLDAAGAPRRFAAAWRDVVPHRLIDITLVGTGRRRAIREHDRRIMEAVGS